VQELSKLCYCTFLLDLYPKSRQATALNLHAAPLSSGLIKMNEVGDLAAYGSMIDLENSLLVNRTSNNPLALSNILLQIKLLFFICKIRPNVIHFNNEIYFNHFYLFFWRKKTLISIHDPFPHSGDEKKANTSVKKFYRWINCFLIKYHLLYNRVMAKDYACDRKIHENRIITSTLGPYHYFAKNNLETYLPSIDFLFFGRICKYKGLDILLHSFRDLLRLYPEAKLCIAGSGVFDFDINECKIPQENLLILNRFIDPTELAELIRKSKFVVCPYRDATQSGVVMTAYAFLKPVIATKVGAIPHSVIDGETGILVEANSVESLLAGLLKAIRGDLSQEIAQEKIKTVFHDGSNSWRAIASNLKEKYMELFC
jgi:glycosyltransferase involved in cell wall biosynthesis